MRGRWQLALMVMALSVLMASTAQAEEKVESSVPILQGEIERGYAEPQRSDRNQSVTTTKIQRLSEIELPATSVKDLFSQLSTPNTSSLIQITAVRAIPTERGVEVILETPFGEQLQITNRSSGNNYIADIPNAQLRLPSGDAFTFRSEKPVDGVTEITVTNLDANSLRVTVTCETALPTVELFDSDAGLIVGVVTATSPTPPTSETPQEDDSIAIVVTGEQDGYRVPNTSTATRIDKPLRDIPQSIQVVPQEVLRDQNVTTYNEALRNVPGVAPFNSSTTQISNFIIRGFLSFNFASNLILRNGLREAGGLNAETTPDVDRIEVLLGPSSVLYGSVNPGRTINLVTKQPLRDPFHAVDATIGSYDLYQGAIDLSGPLDDSGTVLYRLNTSYQDRGSFIDFVEQDQFTITPVVSVAIGKRTRLTLEGEYTETNESNFTGLPAVGTVLPNLNGNIPRNRFVGNPDFVLTSQRSRVGYRLEYEFSDNWSLQNAFQVRFFDRTYADGIRVSIGLEPDNRTLNGILADEEERIDIYDLNFNLIGRFSTGSIEHQLAFGVDLSRYDQNLNIFVAPAVPLDIFNPTYRQLAAGTYDNVSNTSDVTDTLGIYIQDQVTLAENLKLLLGGRFDLFEQTTEDFLADTES